MRGRHIAEKSFSFFESKEQAEVGQWPYLLALCYRYRGFKYPPGILVGFASLLEAINSILSGIPYMQIYSIINKQLIKERNTLRRTIMKMDIITMEDLKQFKMDFLEEMKAVIGQGKQDETTAWLRSAAVRKMLNISPGTLQTLRINGTLPYRKIGGTMFYNKAQIEKLLKGE